MFLLNYLPNLAIANKQKGFCLLLTDFPPPERFHNEQTEWSATLRKNFSRRTQLIFKQETRLTKLGRMILSPVPPTGMYLLTKGESSEKDQDLDYNIETSSEYFYFVYM